MKKRIGIIGLGRMGFRHVEAVRNAGHELVALHDVYPDAFGFTQEPGLRALAQPSLEAFFAAAPDLVVVATTAPSHLPQVRSGLAHGVTRFVVEKPVTSNPADALAMQRAAQEAGARIIVNHGRRYFKAYQSVRDGLSGSARMGDLRMIAITQGAGGLGCLGVHYLDLCNFLFKAKPTEVFATLTTPDGANPRGAEFNDPGGTALLMYPGGRRGVVEMGDDVGVLGQIELRFEFGVIRIVDESRPWTLMARKAEVRERPKSFYGAPMEEIPFPDFSILSVIDAAAAAHADALADGPAVSGVDIAVDGMQILAACHLSHARGRPVALPLADADMAIPLHIP